MQPAHTMDERTNEPTNDSGVAVAYHLVFCTLHFICIRRILHSKTSGVECGMELPDRNQTTAQLSICRSRTGARQGGGGGGGGGRQIYPPCQVPIAQNNWTDVSAGCQSWLGGLRACWYSRMGGGKEKNRMIPDVPVTPPCLSPFHIYTHLLTRVAAPPPIQENLHPGNPQQQQQQHLSIEKENSTSNKKQQTAVERYTQGSGGRVQWYIAVYVRQPAVLM